MMNSVMNGTSSKIVEKNSNENNSNSSSSNSNNSNKTKSDPLASSSSCLHDKEMPHKRPKFARWKGTGSDEEIGNNGIYGVDRRGDLVSSSSSSTSTSGLSSSVTQRSVSDVDEKRAFLSSDDLALQFLPLESLISQRPATLGNASPESDTILVVDTEQPLPSEAAIIVLDDDGNDD